jgi:hypothetical protein
VERLVCSWHDERDVLRVIECCCVLADAYELRKEFGDFVSLRAALSLECEQLSIVLPEFPRVPGWFESPAPEELWPRRVRLEVRVENVLAYCLSSHRFARAVFYRCGLGRLSVILCSVSTQLLAHS